MTLRFTVYLLIIFSSIPYGFYHWKKIRLSFKILVSMLLVIFISESLTRVTNHYLQSSRPWYHILVAIELIMYPLIYYYSFSPKNKFLRRATMFIAVVAPCVSVWWSAHSNLITTFPSGSILLLSLTMIPCSLFGFVSILRQPYLPLSENSFFWFNLGTLVFFTLTFLVFGLANPLSAQYNGMPGWGAEIVYFTNLTCYAFFFVSIYKESKRHEYLART